MASILSSNVIAGRDNRAPAPNLREDGSNYPFRMFYDNNQHIVDADSPGECLSYLITNYDLMTAEEQRQARIELGKGIQLQARANVIVALTQEEIDSLSDKEWEILHYGDGENTDPYGWGDGEGELGEVKPDTIDIWKSKIPLVLLETSYMPYTDIPTPMSSEGDYLFVNNILWIRPDDELEFLRSLNRAGFIAFGSPQAVYQEARDSYAPEPETAE